MDNNNPYIVIEDSSTALHLKERKWRRNALFFLLRIFPIVYFIAMIFFVSNAKDLPPVFLPVAIVAMAIPIIILLNFPLIKEVEVTRLAINIKYSNVFGPKERVIATSDIEKIICRRMRGKFKGYTYAAVFKQSGKKYRFLKFHRFYLNKSRKEALQNQLQTITKLPIQNI